jgi:3-oxoacyl-[acyl-carrier protein] reductase
MLLEGKVAAVCGAGPDIGRSIAMALAENGADVALNVHRHHEVIDETAARIRKLGRRSFPIIADIAEPSDVREMFGRIQAALGPVDILVNNAILRMDSPFLDVSLEGWNAVLRTNLTGPMLCAQAVIAGMVQKSWGRIVNLSGISGWVGNTCRVPIATVKMGIVGFTRALATEVGSYGITVNAISPAGIETSRYRSKGVATYNNDQYIQSQIDATPLRRLGNPEEIGATCVFLCSEGAGFITGQTIAVNGGKYMH